MFDLNSDRLVRADSFFRLLEWYAVRTTTLLEESFAELLSSSIESMRSI